MRITVLVTALVGLYGYMAFHVLENPNDFCAKHETVSYDSCVINFR